jgi:hypothetical protein
MVEMYLFSFIRLHRIKHGDNFHLRVVLSLSYFFFHWLYSPRGPWSLLFSFIIILQTVEHLGRVISSSQGFYLNTGQHKQNKHIHTPNIQALCGIRTHDLSFRAIENSSCFRPLGYCDRPHIFSDFLFTDDKRGMLPFSHIFPCYIIPFSYYLSFHVNNVRR